MTFVHGSKGKIYLGGADLSPFAKTVSTNYSVDSAETSTLGNTFKTYVPGLRDGTISIDGVYDGTAANCDALLTSALTSTTDDLFTYLPQGEAGIGGAAFGFASIATSYQVQGGVADVTGWTLAGQNDMGMDKGVIQHPFIAEGAGGQSVGVDNVLTSTLLGGVGYLQVSAGTSLIVKIQDSADNITFADILTFASASAQGAQRVVIAGTVRRYTRALWTGTGTFSAIFCRK